MANREIILELIRRAYVARGKGDLEELMTAFHPDAVFALVGDTRTLEIAGSIHGHHSLREAMDRFIATFHFVERQILSELVEEERAAVHSRFMVRYGPTGAIRTTEVLDLFKFQDGKIIELLEFADTALIKDMMSAASERPSATT
jgi:ketosteroid isomerase-like protein